MSEHLEPAGSRARGAHPGRRDGHPGPGSSGRSRRRGTSAPAGSPATDRRRPRRGRAEQQLAHPLLPDPRRCAPMASNWVEAVNRMVSALAPTRYGRAWPPRARGAPFHITRSHQSESPRFQGIASSAFTTHGLCDSGKGKAWIGGVHVNPFDWLNVQESFHPTPAGQSAYEASFRKAEGV